MRLSRHRKPCVIGLHNPRPENLDAILRTLSDFGCFVPYERMADELLTGKTPPPGFVVTFDDGYAENMDLLEVLANHRCQAMFFVSTATLDRPNPLWFMNTPDPERLKARLRQLPYHAFLSEIEESGLTKRAPNRDRFGLTTAELRTIRSHGHGIGIHTHNHVFLSSLSPADVEEEIQTCSKLLRDALASNDLPLHVAYPDGNHDAQVVQTMLSLGALTAVTTNPGSLAEARLNPLALPRVMLDDDEYPGYAAFKTGSIYKRMKRQHI